MTGQGEVIARTPEIAADQLGFFRWGEVAGKPIVTNDAGDWVFLEHDELADLLSGKISADHPRFAEFQRYGLIREGLDLDAFAARVAQRFRHLNRGLRLHVVTLANRDGQMNRQTAEQIIELALQGKAPAITFELVGHGVDPLSNFEVLRHFVEVARRRNQQGAGVTLAFSVVSSFAALSEEIAEWLLANDVFVSTYFDGPAELHDANLNWRPGATHAEVVAWLDYFQRRYAELGRDAWVWYVDALLAVTRRTLSAATAVVDEYVARGLRRIHLQPLNPALLDTEAWRQNGYSVAEYLEFYRHTLDYILNLNRTGKELVERSAAVFLAKVLSSEDPGVVDIQSPSGAGSSQVAHGIDGGVYPSEDACRWGENGDPIFRLGSADELSPTSIANHQTVRAIAAASLLETQPTWADSWNKPYLGVDPVYTYMTQGDMFGQRHRCLQSQAYIGVVTRLFELLATKDDKTMTVLEGWGTSDVRLAGDERAAKRAC